MELFKRKSINASVLFSFSGILIVMLVFGILFLSNLKKIQDYKEISEKLGQLKENASDMTNDEYSLMLKEQSNEYFINTGKSRYIEKFRLKYRDNQQLLVHLTDVYQVKDQYFQEKISTIKNNIDQDNAIFNKLVANIREIGFFNLGLIGELRDFIHEQEKIISKLPDSTMLAQKVLSIRRYEKDFLAWKNIRFRDRLVSLVEDYKKVVINHPRIDIGTQKKLIENIEKYQTTFIRITDKTKVIGFTSEDGLSHEQEVLSQTIATDIDVLTKYFDVHYTQSTSKTFVIIVFYFIISLSIILLLTIQHSRRLTLPLNKVKKFVTELCSGEFPEKMQISTSSEIQDIIDVLNNFVMDLEQKAQYAEKIGQGDFDAEYVGIMKDDKLALALIEMSSKLKSNNESEILRKKNEENELWAAKGLSYFNDILRLNHDSIEKISYHVISSLIEYLQVNQGGIFIVRGKDVDPYLELVSSYAFNKERKIQKIVQFKEGLIGTCAIEKSTIYLDRVPPKYMKLTSGLGESEPESLLLVPVMNSGELFGIIELASFKHIQPHEIKFVEKLAENIAITFLTVQITEQTSTLLARTLEQAEELEKRDEQMRYNIVELKASQEDAARREAQMVGLLSGLNASTFMIEYDIEANIVNINDKYLKLLNMPRNKVLGQNHRKFTNMDSIVEYPDGYVNFWNHLRRGFIQTKITKIPGFIQKEEIWLSEVYAPVLDSRGETQKVLCIGIDISSNKKQEQILALQGQQLANKEAELIENLRKINDATTALETESLILEILVQNSKDSIFIKDIEGKYTKVNQPFLKGIGVSSEEEIIGKTVFDVFDPKYASQHAETDKMIIESGKPIFNILEHDKTERGSEYWLQVNKIPIINKQRETVGIIGITHNITQEKKAEQQIRDAIENLTSLQKKYKTISEIQQDMSIELATVQSDWDGIMLSFENSFSFSIIQLDGTIIQANELYAKQLNSKVEDLIGNNILQNLKGEAAKKFLPIWQRITKGESYSAEVRELNRDGHETWMLVHYQPVRDVNQVCTKVFYIGLDITYYKHTSDFHSNEVDT